MPHWNSVPGPAPTSPHQGHPYLLLQKLAHSVCVHVCLCVFMSVYVGMYIRAFRVSICLHVFFRLDSRVQWHPRCTGL